MMHKPPIGRWRLPKRCVVTIIAGFNCSDGVVVCADTQETTNNLSKKSIPKLRYEQGPYPNFETQQYEKADLAAAFCGAGDNGPFIDKLIDRAWEAVRDASDLHMACNAAEVAIKEMYKEFGLIYQQGECPQVELIYGIKMEQQSRLFLASGPVVNEKNGYASSGIGYYIADFIASRMYGAHLTTRQCVILAAYILFHAKEHVEGCGGDSQIAVLRNDESSGLVEWRLVKEITEYLESSDRYTGDILLATANLATPQVELDEKIREIIETLTLFRNHHVKEIQNHREWEAQYGIATMLGINRPTDDLGLPVGLLTLLDSQTSEGPQ